MTRRFVSTVPAKAPFEPGAMTGLWIATHPGFAASRHRLTLPRLAARLGP